MTLDELTEAARKQAIDDGKEIARLVAEQDAEFEKSSRAWESFVVESAYELLRLIAPERNGKVTGR